MVSMNLRQCHVEPFKSSTWQAGIFPVTQVFACRDGVLLPDDLKPLQVASISLVMGLVGHANMERVILAVHSWALHGIGSVVALHKTTPIATSPATGAARRWRKPRSTRVSPTDQRLNFLREQTSILSNDNGDHPSVFSHTKVLSTTFSEIEEMLESSSVTGLIRASTFMHQLSTCTNCPCGRSVYLRVGKRKK